MNNSQIVGKTINGYQGVLYENGNIVYLNSLLPLDSGWTSMIAVDINNSGQIIGYGMLNNESVAFLMTPIPEPAALFIFTLGGLLLRKH